MEDHNTAHLISECMRIRLIHSKFVGTYAEYPPEARDELRSLVLLFFELTCADPLQSAFDHLPQSIIQGIRSVECSLFGRFPSFDPT